MKLLDIISTASTNMFRSKLRTTLTIIAIFIGAFTLTLTNGLGSGISSYIDKQVKSLGAEDILIIRSATGNSGLPGEPQKYDPNKRTASIESEGNRTVVVLTNADLEKIRKVEGIKSAEAYQNVSLDYISGKSDDKYLANIERFISGEKFPLDAGRLPDNNATSYEVMLPAINLAFMGYDNARAALGQTVKLAVTNGFGKQSEITATITGIQQKNLVGGGAVYVNAALHDELRRVQTTGLPASATNTFQAAVAYFDPNISDTHLTELKDRLKKAGYNAQTVEDQVGSFKAVINGIVAVLNGFAIIALLAASFGIINTLLMSVQERTKEIGLMKAMGMGAGRIFLLFSFEAMMLGFWGSLIGSAAAIGVGNIINRIALNSFLKDLVGLQLLAFTAASVAVIVGAVMAIAFIAGTLPAVRAARQDPIESLRYE